MSSEDSTEHTTPIMCDSFRSGERWLWWGRLCLYVDRLELSGWRGWTSFHRDLPLARLVRVRAPTQSTLTVHPRNQDAVSVQVDKAPQWARSVRAFRACLDTSD
jgi:hypothetical protein